jgi:hypothetical protein
MEERSVPVARTASEHDLFRINRCPTVALKNEMSTPTATIEGSFRLLDNCTNNLLLLSIL